MAKTISDNPDENGHIWNGKVSTASWAKFPTCSRCGCDVSEGKACWPCEGLAKKFDLLEPLFESSFKHENN